MLKKVIGASRPPSAQSVGDAYQEHEFFGYRGLGRQINPALHASYVSPQTFAPAGNRLRSTGAQAQCGFECVTLLLQGQLDARNSLQDAHTLNPGDVLWSGAGGGFLQELRHGPDLVQNGGTLELLTLWINLPSQYKLIEPHCQFLPAALLPEVPLSDGGGTVRVISGEYGKQIGPAETVTPVQLWDLRLQAGRSVTLPLQQGWYAVLLVLEGRMYGRYWPDMMQSPQLVVLDAAGQEATFEVEQDSRVILLSCQPIDEPIVGSEALIMNTEEQLMQTQIRLQNGQFGEIL